MSAPGCEVAIPGDDTVLPGSVFAACFRKAGMYGEKKMESCLRYGLIRIAICFRAFLVATMGLLPGCSNAVLDGMGTAKEVPTAEELVRLTGLASPGRQGTGRDFILDIAAADQTRRLGNGREWHKDAPGWPVVYEVVRDDLDETLAEIESSSASTLNEQFRDALVVQVDRLPAERKREIAAFYRSRVGRSSVLIDRATAPLILDAYRRVEAVNAGLEPVPHCRLSDSHMERRKAVLAASGPMRRMSSGSVDPLDQVLSVYGCFIGAPLDEIGENLSMKSLRSIVAFHESDAAKAMRSAHTGALVVMMRDPDVKALFAKLSDRVSVLETRWKVLYQKETGGSNDE